jgi:hypothetical protein
MRSTQGDCLAQVVLLIHIGKVGGIQQAKIRRELSMPAGEQGA